MTEDTLEPMMLTFIYFLHKQDTGDDSMDPETFFSEWSGNHYDFTLMSNGRFWDE